MNVEYYINNDDQYDLVYTAIDHAGHIPNANQIVYLGVEVDERDYPFMVDQVHWYIKKNIAKVFLK